MMFASPSESSGTHGRLRSKLQKPHVSMNVPPTHIMDHEPCSVEELRCGNMGTEEWRYYIDRFIQHYRRWASVICFSSIGQVTKRFQPATI